MINGMPIFYNSKIGRGLEPVQTKRKRVFNLVQTKKGKGCNKKCNKKRIKGSGLKILK